MTEPETPLTADEETNLQLELDAYGDLHGYRKIVATIDAERATIAALRTQLEQAHGDRQADEKTIAHLATLLEQAQERAGRLEAMDAKARQKLIERAQGNRMPPHPEPLQTMGYWRERCTLAEAQLEQAQGNFQRETLRTSELSVKLREVVENLCPQHGPGSWGRHGCRYCNLLMEIQELLARPINAPAEPCACAPGDTCTCAEDCDCRERDAHIWKYDVGWRNIEGLQETRRDTEVYE